MEVLGRLKVVATWEEKSSIPSGAPTRLVMRDDGVCFWWDGQNQKWAPCKAFGVRPIPQDR